MHDELLRRAAAHADAYLHDIRDRHVAATLTGEALKTMLGVPLAEEGSDPQGVIDALAMAGRDGTVATQGPRYFGFVIGGSVPAAIAADWLVSAWDQNACVFVMSPLAAVVEQIVAGWVTSLVGLPSSWSAGFVTGCRPSSRPSRRRLGRRARWPVWRAAGRRDRQRRIALHDLHGVEDARPRGRTSAARAHRLARAHARGSPQ